MPAPRKALASCKRGKRPASQLSESERREGLDKLKAIKTKHAPKALELVRKALGAVKELQALEEVNMSVEAASGVHAEYNTVFSEFKLTFEAADGDLAAEMDHEFIGLEDMCEQALEECLPHSLPPPLPPSLPCSFSPRRPPFLSLLLSLSPSLPLSHCSPFSISPCVSLSSFSHRPAPLLDRAGRAGKLTRTQLAL